MIELFRRHRPSRTFRNEWPKSLLYKIRRVGGEGKRSGTEKARIDIPPVVDPIWPMGGRGTRARFVIALGGDNRAPSPRWSIGSVVSSDLIYMFGKRVRTLNGLPRPLPLLSPAKGAGTQLWSTNTPSIGTQKTRNARAEELLEYFRDRLGPLQPN